MLPESLIARLVDAHNRYLPNKSPAAASDAVKAIEEETPAGTSFLIIATVVHSLKPRATPKTLEHHHAFVLRVLLRSGEWFIRS